MMQTIHYNNRGRLSITKLETATIGEDDHIIHLTIPSRNISSPDMLRIFNIIRSLMTLITTEVE